MAEAARHSLFDGKVQVYLRPGSPHWQCSCTVAGRQKRSTTKEESLARAKDVARDWYLGLMGKYRAGEIKHGKTFREAADKFIDEFEVITMGQRSPIYVQGHKDRLKNHLIPFFGDKVLSEITPGLVQDCRTSVEMIETYYASHIKNTLDAAAINVRKARRETAAMPQPSPSRKSPRSARSKNPFAN